MEIVGTYTKLLLLLKCDAPLNVETNKNNILDFLDWDEDNNNNDN